MKRYGIFGGTFNPPHLAHSVLAENARVELNLDKIIIIPSAVPPLKNEKDVLEIAHRLEMAKIAFGNIPDYEVSEIEINNSNGKSYTADTLIKLHELYKNAQVGFYLILGIDGLIDFPKWKNPERIFELAEVVILSRPGFSKDKIKSEYLKKVRFIDAELLNISSTMIRDKVRNNKSIKSLVLPEIEKYITQNKLYK